MSTVFPRSPRKKADAAGHGHAHASVPARSLRNASNRESADMVSGKRARGGIQLKLTGEFLESEWSKGGQWGSRVG